MSNINFWCRKPNENGVYPAFPVKENKSQGAAETWTKKLFHRKYINADEYELADSNNCLYEKVVYEHNNLFDYVEFTSLEIRNGGGRAFSAFKVLLHFDNKKFLVDFREFELLDVIKNAGIQAGGILNGQYMYTEAGQFKLTRIGSETHQASLHQLEDNTLCHEYN